MKIGILTYHRAHNYGALLQAIATRTVLITNGHDVSYIDYWPSYHANRYRFFSIRKFRRRGFRYLWDLLLLRNETIKRIETFNKDINSYIDPYCSKDTKFDVIIYGSDQIWRKQVELNSYNSIYFADGHFNAPVQVSYAASMGTIHKEDSALLKKLLGNFTTIGVREENLRDYIKELGFNCYLNVDPTLLLTSKEWDRIMNVRRIIDDPYVLFYNLNDNVFDNKTIAEYASINKMRFVEICGEAKKENPNVYPYASLCEFVSLVKYADVVFTSSFHGLVFSLLYHKRVYASNKSNTMRQKLLLSRLGLQELFVEPKTKVFPNIEIDYDVVDSMMDNMRKNSISYLNNYIENY